MSKNKVVGIIVAIVGVIFAVLELLGFDAYDTVYEFLGLKEKPIDVDCELAVHFIDVGQGDCQLIISGNDVVLIDGGEKTNAADVCAYLDSHDIERIDYLIATHPHSDHIGSLPIVIENYDIGTVIAPNLPSELIPASTCYIDFLQALKDKKLSITSAKCGDEYTLDGGTLLQILGPVEFDNELNNASVICRILHGENSFLFTGDAEKSAEDALLESGAYLDSDVLKVGHHGSPYSSCEEFLQAVTPEIAVIGVGADNDYGHPGDDVIERIEVHTGRIYRTDFHGTVVIGSDGTQLTIVTENKVNSLTE